MLKPSHGSEPEPHLHSCDLRWFVFEALGQEECHVRLRMLISKSKFLREPFNRTIDVFFYFMYIFLFHFYFIIITIIIIFTEQDF